MAKERNWLEVVTNLAILCVCIFIIIIGTKRFLLPSHVQQARPGIGLNNAVPTLGKGTQISLPNVEWSRSNRTVVLVLNTGCHFCSESATFYKRLLPQASAQNIPVVAVFPQPPEEGRQYLTKHEIPVSNVAVTQAPLETSHFSGTPTLIIVDRKGLVVRSWVGKLSAQGESEVLQQLHS